MRGGFNFWGKIIGFVLVISSGMGTFSYGQVAFKTPINPDYYYDVAGIILRRVELNSVTKFQERAVEIFTEGLPIGVNVIVEKDAKSDIETVVDYWSNYFDEYRGMCNGYNRRKNRILCEEKIDYLEKVNLSLFTFLFTVQTTHPIPNGIADKILIEYSEIHDLMLKELEVTRKETDKKSRANPFLTLKKYLK